jgi:hypothetical protein
LSRAGRIEERQTKRRGLASDAGIARHQPEVRAERTRMSLKHPQVERPKRNPLPLRPDEQDARRLGPGHLVLDRDEIIVRFEREQVSLDKAIINRNQASL